MNPSMQKADKLLTDNYFEWFIKYIAFNFFFLGATAWVDLSLVKILKELCHEMYQNSNSGMFQQI